METKADLEWMKLPCAATGPREVRRTRSGKFRRFWILGGISFLFGIVALATYAQLRPMENLAREGKIYRAFVVRNTIFLRRTQGFRDWLVFDVEVRGQVHRFEENAPFELAGLKKGQEFLITAIPSNPSAHMFGPVDKKALANQRSLAMFTFIVGLLMVGLAAFIEHAAFAKQAKKLRDFDATPSIVFRADASNVEGFRHQEVTFRYLTSDHQVVEFNSQPIGQDLRPGQRMVVFLDPRGIEAPVMPWDHPLAEVGPNA